MEQQNRNARWGWEILIFLSLLLAGTAGLLFFPAPRYSKTENRILAEMPPFTFSAFQSGSYGAAVDTFTAERFPFREPLRGLYAIAELIQGKHEVNGVILTKDGSLLRRMQPRVPLLKENLQKVKTFEQNLQQSGVPVAVAIPPRRVDVCPLLLPFGYSDSDEEEIRAAVKTALPEAITFSGVFDGDKWFRTDHHWNVEGAFLAYREIALRLGVTPLPREAFRNITVSEAFGGSSYAKAGIPFLKKEKLSLLEWEGEEEFHLKKDGKEVDFRGLYDIGKEGYDVFLGGNAGVTEVNLGENDARPTLFLIKDSFGNSVIPFLAHHFRIVAVDPRYYRGSLAPFLSSAEKALFLVGLETMGDTRLFK